MGEGCKKSTGQVTDMTQCTLHVIAKNPQVEHVAKQVGQACMNILIRAAYTSPKQYLEKIER